MAAVDFKKSLRRYRKITAIMCLMGFTLSCYAVYVDMAKEKDPTYRAMCDISARISCSVVFTSKYGKGFGIIGILVGEDSVINQQNGVYGILMYPFFFLISRFAISFLAALELMLGTLSVIVSLYLGYILFYILEDACVVCISTYLINLVLFFCALLNYKAVKSLYLKRRDSDYTEYLHGKTKKSV